MGLPLSTDRATPNAVELHALTKRYGDVVALDGLTLAIPSGSFFGLLGPNGAGKTTTVSILTTLERASSGEARLFGFDVRHEGRAARSSIGVVFQQSSLDPELTPREHLELQGRLYRLEDWKPRAHAMLEAFGLASDAERVVRRLSGGMRRRLELARGLLHRPRILFLDEPTVGLDVAARASFWAHLRRVQAERETTIFLTTHSMEEAETLCERVAILDAGRLVVDGAPAELQAALGGDVVRLVLQHPDGAVAALERVEGVARVVHEAARARVRIVLKDGPQRLASLLEVARSFGVREVTLHRPTLEHVFLHHTGHPFEPKTDEGSAP